LNLKKYIFFDKLKIYFEIDRMRSRLKKGNGFCMDFL